MTLNKKYMLGDVNGEDCSNMLAVTVNHCAHNDFSNTFHQTKHQLIQNFYMSGRLSEMEMNVATYLLLLNNNSVSYSIDGVYAFNQLHTTHLSPP